MKKINRIHVQIKKYYNNRSTYCDQHIEMNYYIKVKFA